LNGVDFPLQGLTSTNFAPTNHFAPSKGAKIFKCTRLGRNIVRLQQPLTPANHNQNQIATMADGIDRKADERMEFTTSKDVTVAPTFTERVFPSFSRPDVF